MRLVIVLAAFGFVNAFVPSSKRMLSNPRTPRELWFHSARKLSSSRVFSATVADAVVISTSSKVRKLSNFQVVMQI
jgi:hypothetical protein